MTDLTTRLAALDADLAEGLRELGGGKLTDAELANIAAHFGYTITDPGPPEAMVRLADVQWCWHGDDDCDYHANHDEASWKAGYLAALQRAGKAVEDAPGVLVNGYSHISRDTILTQLGKVQP